MAKRWRVKYEPSSSTNNGPSLAPLGRAKLRSLGKCQYWSGIIGHPDEKGQFLIALC